MTPILGGAPFGYWRAEDWARARGATEEFASLALVYWMLASSREVNPAVAYAQSAKETGFGRFGGTDPVFSATPAHRNPCGLKSHDGKRTQRFPSWTYGIAAHLDHLGLYAGSSRYPLPSSPDPRHFSFLHGTAPTVEALGGKWAPAFSYGESIVHDFLETM